MDDARQDWGRCKVKMAEKLNKDAMHKLPTIFGFEEDFDETIKSKIDFIKKLEQKAFISSKDITELLKALEDIESIKARNEIEAIFQEFDRSSKKREYSQETFNSTSEDQGPSKRWKRDTEEKEKECERESTNQFCTSCTVKAIDVLDDREADEETGYLAAVCVILDMTNIREDYHLGQNIGVYLFESNAFRFKRGKFYEIERCTLSRRNENLELLVYPETAITRISVTTLKTKPEQIAFDKIDRQQFTPTRCLPIITVDDVLDNYRGKSCGILSLRGIIFQINTETDDERINFKFTDDGENFVYIVSPGNLDLDDDIVDKATVKLTHLKTDSQDGETRYLLCTGKTKIKQLTDQKLANLLECDLVNEAHQVRGKVIKCKQEESYYACKECFQTKLKDIGKGNYECKKCKRSYETNEADLCHRIHLVIRGDKEVSHKGILFQKTVDNILKQEFPDSPSERKVDVLDDILIDREVEVSMKECSPPLSNVFSNFKLQ